MDDLNIEATPFLNWAYTENDEHLNGLIGSVRNGDPLPSPVSGDYVFVPSLSANE